MPRTRSRAGIRDLTQKEIAAVAGAYIIRQPIWGGPMPIWPRPIHGPIPVDPINPGGPIIVMPMSA